MKNKILQEFLNSDIKIKSQQKLEEYIDYCMVNNQKEHTKSKTAQHHILPKSLFKDFKDLKYNTWNGTFLKHSKHYKAHFLLTEAIDNRSMLSAFTAMHNRDIKSSRITENDLITEEIYQIKVEDCYKKHSKFLRDNADKYGWKQAKTATKKIIIDGKITSIAKLRSEKAAKTAKEEIIINGKITSIAKERANKAAITRQNKSLYILYKNEKVIRDLISKKELRELSQNLHKATKKSPMGSSYQSATKLKEKNKENLIGMYVEIFK